jgi:methionine aminopeptidase
MLDYTLGNPDTITKYKTAGQISQKVLQEVAGMSARHLREQLSPHKKYGLTVSRMVR